ncbi:MAG: acyltransferase [Sphingomonas sp.]|nr:acyltransferase [Sphingomonas sp.]
MGRAAENNPSSKREFDRAKSLLRANNLDLIRLILSLQVMAMHAQAHLRAPFPHWGRQLLELTPALPIFFFISGLLVTASFARRSLREYAEARIRRIFPALWLTFFLTVPLLFVAGQITRQTLMEPHFWVWVATQLTVLQVYHPSFFHHFGVGVVNGSLWTIPVEIGFYVTLPVLAWMAGGLRQGKQRFSAIIVSAGVLSCAIYAMLEGNQSLLAKILFVTPIANFWYFAFGIMVFLNFERVMRWLAPLRGYPAGFLYPLLLFVLIRVQLSGMLPEAAVIVVTFPLVVAAILGLAYVAKPLAGVLHGVDLSYSTYLFHMLVVNSLVELGILGWQGVLLTFAVTLTLAFLSWSYVEAPVLHRTSAKSSNGSARS